MTGHTLTESCKIVIDGIAAQSALDGCDPDYAKRDAISAIILPTLDNIVATRAATLWECKAKVTVHLTTDRDDLAASIMQDILSLV